MAAKSKTKTALSPDVLSFEAALAELDETVRQLEAGDLSLDESLALFERGQLLSARCQQLLQAAIDSCQPAVLEERCGPGVINRVSVPTRLLDQVLRLPRQRPKILRR